MKNGRADRHEERQINTTRDGILSVPADKRKEYQKVETNGSGKAACHYLSTSESIRGKSRRETHEERPRYEYRSNIYKL